MDAGLIRVTVNYLNYFDVCFLIKWCVVLLEGELLTGRIA